MYEYQELSEFHHFNRQVAPIFVASNLFLVGSNRFKIARGLSFRQK